VQHDDGWKRIVAAAGRLRAERTRGDRGSALVEAAIVLPIVVLMVFGIVEIGFLFRSATIVSTSTRSGARLAAAQYGSATTPEAQLAVIDNVRLTVEKDLVSRAGVDTPQDLWIYQADANGNPVGGDTSGAFSSCGPNCYKYSWDASTGHFGVPSGSWSSPNACGINHDSVGVFVRATHKPIGFSSVFGAFTIKEQTVMRLEPAGTTVCPSGT
jgi:hypothetical protein